MKGNFVLQHLDSKGKPLVLRNNQALGRQSQPISLTHQMRIVVSRSLLLEHLVPAV